MVYNYIYIYIYIVRLREGTVCLLTDGLCTGHVSLHRHEHIVALYSILN